MIKEGAFDLGNWELVPSSEQGMLAQVNRKSRRQDWIVFLAWEPHPMNKKFDITYLSGGDEYFGANYGGTTINTLARRGYAEQCPNAGKLFSQLVFSTEMENAIMEGIEDKRQDASVAATEYLKANPEPIAAWLDGVTTRHRRTGPPGGTQGAEAELSGGCPSLSEVRMVGRSTPSP